MAHDAGISKKSVFVITNVSQISMALFIGCGEECKILLKNFENWGCLHLYEQGSIQNNLLLIVLMDTKTLIWSTYMKHKMFVVHTQHYSFGYWTNKA